LIDAIIALMATDNKVTGPINLGNATEFTILELAELVIELTGSRSKIVYAARQQDDPRQRRPDISRANELLSWTPKTPPRLGLGRTIAYFENLLTDADVRSALLLPVQ
jgi:UDP-glucuronate decarboxylase